MDYSKLISNIDLLSKKRGVSRSKSLSESGAGKDFVVNIEKKSQSPSIVKIMQLSNYFDVSIDYLLGVENKNVEYAAQPSLTENEQLIIDLMRKLPLTEQGMVLLRAKDILVEFEARSAEAKIG